MRPDKLSIKIFGYADLRVRYSVQFNSEDFPPYEEFEFGDKTYGAINSLGVVTLEIRNKEYEEYDNARSILLTPLSLPGFIDSVKIIIKNIYNKDTYQVTTNNKLILDKDTIITNTVKYQIPNTSNLIVLEPCIVTDDTNVEYEGVRMYFSRRDIWIDIPIQYWEALYRALDKIDFVTYGLMCMQFVNVYKHKDEIPKKRYYNDNRQKVIFDSPKEIITGFKKPPEDDAMMGLDTI